MFLGNILSVKLFTPSALTRDFDWIRIISPIETLTIDSCLTFLYHNRFTDIALYHYNESSLGHIATITHNGQAVIWKYAMYELKAGHQGIIFQFNRLIAKDKNIALDEIRIENATCSRIGVV